MASPRNERRATEPGDLVAADYATRLLDALPHHSHAGRNGEPLSARHPALEWAHSGAMSLSGSSSGPPRVAPGNLAACCRGAALALRGLSLAAWPENFDAPALLGERAAIFGLERQGAIAPGGSCRFVKCADGWIAINLARPDDHSLLPAWLAEGDWSHEARTASSVWNRVALAARTCTASSLLSRARLMGLAAALPQRGHPLSDAGPEPVETNAVWCRSTRCNAPRRRASGETPLVVDLSSLWAGPLCTHLLSLSGARVIKLESRSRPDGARFGPAPFFDLMNAGKQSVALDFTSRDDLQRLRKLLAAADIVVESARPRALRQLGIEAETLLRTTPGQVWVSITGYGRGAPEGDWVAFGDDAAVSAGLTLDPETPAAAPLFCGDAIADPLTGLHAAVAGLASWHAGGGVLLDIPLREVVAHAMTFGTTPAAAELRRSENRTDGPGWEVHADGDLQAVLPPRARPVRQPARPLGVDTAAVLAEFAASC